jgi:hypothetical protein
MIKFEYTNPSDGNVEGKIHVYIDSESYKYFNKNQFPLRLTHKNLMGGIEWHSDLYPNHFSQNKLT